MQGIINTARELIDRYNTGKSIKIMEVCGSHTMAISKYGLRQILPPNIKLISGPGCPVCVTAQNEIDASISLASQGVTIATFGDLVRVPGNNSSLQEERAKGRDVRVFYSPLDALDYAMANPSKEVVFIGIGFETTIPSVALTIKEAYTKKIKNYSVYCLHKTMPKALEALVVNGSDIQGFLLPGHVSAITGSTIYNFLVDKYKIGGVVSGFEASDILMSVVMILKNLEDPKIEIQYKRVVKDDGNIEAQKLIEEVFEDSDAEWRGLGMIEGSGLKIREKYSEYDAEKKFNIKKPNSGTEIKGCRCGDVLKGIITPKQCPLFGKACTPLNPVGPCMVSSEGSCAAYYKYGE
ncbi:hydrogenase formation protein HypD [Thermoanaerobacterium thermosaccharolyticum]|uniref:hydrogenase formation protein HypD n=1 Tax=Thermoanaerobacterium thermosaccharolyticum TaxID=1517 RepID=UPI00177B9EA3|nr:hydrogenase formation protein HypD [Thermoanaerobacterium thermosaccharolyticum]MBE0067627.1 hydrogenase formation protein HypD [Thermoanaerobacterium thermosaccharolyticum]MBE0227211.1 hydrogenase formation protein HypD [Thermoanaerobacterium thermosaccharolyticum]